MECIQNEKMREMNNGMHSKWKMREMNNGMHSK